MGSNSQNSFAREKASTLLVLLLIMSVQSLSQYKIDWYTIDGGGGTSTGGQFTLTGTIGQPDAAWSSGGPYTLTGTIGQPDAAWSSGGDYELLGGF